MSKFLDRSNHENLHRPLFLGVKAETKQEAIEKSLAFLEYALDIGNDEETFPHYYVGSIDEGIEQEKQARVALTTTEQKE